MLRKLMNQRMAPMINASKRQYKQFSRNYVTGFDRMLLDKFSFTGINGQWFALHKCEIEEQIND